MTPEELDIEFKEAVEQINNFTEPYPADFLLRLYAYYKKATDDYGRPGSKKPIINAFTIPVFLKGLNNNSFIVDIVKVFKFID